MSKKTLAGIALGIVILIIFGFYIYQTSAFRINVPDSVDYSGKLMPNFRDSNVSLSMLSRAEEKIDEVEILLEKVKTKDLSEYGFLHRQFLENMIDLVEDRFDESKDRLDKAKDALENEDYGKVGENAYLSRVISSTLPRHLNNVMEGRTKDEWNRETAIMGDDSTPINYTIEIPVDEFGEPIRNVTPPDCDSYECIPTTEEEM